MSRRDPQGFSVEYSERAVGGRVKFGKTTPFLSTAGVYVLPNDPLASDTDNNPNTPYRTIQAAVDDALRFGRSVVFIQAGVYDETVIVDDGPIKLVALGWKDSVVIAPQTADYPALVASSATRASLATWLAGGSANYDANYAALIANVTVGDVRVVGIRLEGEGNCYGAAAVGPGGAVNLELLEQTQTTDTNETHAVYGRVANVRMENCQFPQDLNHAFDFTDSILFVSHAELGTLTMSGQSRLNGNFSVFNTIVANDDTLLGNDSDYGRLTFVHINTSLFLNNDASANLSNVFIGTNLELDDASVALLRSGFVGVDIDVEGDAQLDMEDIHVGGVQNYVNAGGAVACTMLGGRYMGLITDPGGRLTRTLGS